MLYSHCGYYPEKIHTGSVLSMKTCPTNISHDITNEINY